MKKILLLVTLMVSGNPLFAADSDGKALHDAQLYQVPRSERVYPRNRFVTNREALANQVRRCEQIWT